MAKLLSEPGLMLDGECPSCGFPLYRTAYPAVEAEKKQLPCRVCALRAEVERLNAEIDSVKAMHNGYDPEARKNMLGLEEPRSLKEAVESLIKEAEWMGGKETVERIRRMRK